MTAESARAFEALEEQAARLMSIFVAAGYDAVAPAIIQPADVFLDVVGEELRARTYVFTDLDGNELCLRPDLTVPACRIYLERHPDAATAARYCYNGPAFRFQRADASASHPREFRQAGIEFFSGADAAEADIEVLRLTQEAVRTAGLGDCKLRIGDIGLFDAVLGAIELPDRWRRRLHATFWRPEVFRAELQRLAAPQDNVHDGLPRELLDQLDDDDVPGAEARVAGWLESHGIELFGRRTIPEITSSLMSALEDRRAAPLPSSVTGLLAEYLAVSGPAHAVADRIAKLTRAHGLNVQSAINTYSNRLQLCRKAGIALDEAEFDADFGRNFEYYTGFVFELLSSKLDPGSPIAGGGRYDRLLRVIGAPVDVPAVGAMIHTERLLSIVDGRGRAA